MGYEGAPATGGSSGCVPARAARWSAHPSRPWHCLYFLPEPHGQGSLRPIFCPERTNGCALEAGASEVLADGVARDVKAALALPVEQRYAPFTAAS